MDDNRIREIFFEHLQDKEPNEAVAESYRQISEEILRQLYEGETVDRPTWELLLKIIKGIARINLYPPFFEQSDVDTIAFGPEFFGDISFFFQTWRDAIAYIIEHYDELMSDGIKSSISAERMKRVVLADIDEQITIQGKYVARNGRVMFGRDEVKLLTLGLTWGLLSIMTKNRYLKLTDEFNKNLPMLKIYYAQVAAPPGREGSKSN